MTALRSLMRSVCGLLLALLAATSLAHAEDYRIASGDVVEFSVAGVPDLQRRASVSMDGSIVLPVLGRVDAAGLTVTELRQRVADGLAHKSIPLRKPDGGDDWVIFNGDQITIAIGEYRPVYINGDIAKPGEQVYRANMTVRQAVAVAGGYAFLRLKMDNPIIEVTDLRSQYDVLRQKYEATRAKLIRLNAQLSGKSGLEAPAADSDSLRKQMEGLEAQRMAAMDLDYTKERAALDLAVTKALKRMSYLVEQQHTDDEGTKEDTEEFTRVKELFEKGLLQITRLNDARRAVLLSATRALQTNSEVTQLEREQGELQRAQVKLENQRRLDLLADVQTATATIAETNSQMEAVSDKLLYVGGLRTELMRSDRHHPEVKITRVVDGVPKSITVSEDATLSPGDVVDVSLSAEYQAQVDDLPSANTK